MPVNEEEKAKHVYGFLPVSVWDVVKSPEWRKKIKDPGDPLTTRLPATHRAMPGLRYSEFIPDIAERIVRFWSELGDLVVDPFSGRATRAIVTIELGRNYQGYEIATKTWEFTVERLRALEAALPAIPEGLSIRRGKVEIVLGDGCFLASTKDLSADLIMTCPPYHQQERYESVPGQLSDLDSYDDFMQQMALCAHNCYRVLKPGKFCVFVIADWRKDGDYYSFHMDLDVVFRQAGFKLWDIIISKLNSPFAWVSVGGAARNKHTAKVHEYIMVWRKPE